jgi:transposase InsO family protein
MVRRGCRPRSRQEERSTGAKRIARLRRAAGLVGASRRRSGVTTTRRDKEARPAPDLVDRNFVASRPNQLWVADITFVPTASGFLYLAVVLDAWSRKVVGWSMANHLRTELVLDALEMAIVVAPAPLIHPKLAEIYRQRIEQLNEALYDTATEERGLRADPLVDRRDPLSARGWSVAD